MQLDGAAITIERRRITGCIDLAVVFIQQHFLAVAQMTLWFAVPSTVACWLIMSQTELDIWTPMLMFVVFSPMLGAVLTIGAGRRVFGDDFRVDEAFKTLRARFWKLFFYILGTRLSYLLVCLILPPLLVTVRYSFLAEILFLESTPPAKVGVRLKNLMTNVYSDLVGRGLTALCFFAIVVVGLYVLVELVSYLLLGIPIAFGRLDGMSNMEDEIWLLLLSDPRFATVIHALMWLVYPLVRLAWFFCYLDVRIQKEGWDVELDFRIEAQRLNELA